MILTIGHKAFLSALLFKAKNHTYQHFNTICFAPDNKVYSTDGCIGFIGKHETEDLKENILVLITAPVPKKFEKAILDTDTRIIRYVDKNNRDVVGFSGFDIVDSEYPCSKLDDLLLLDNVAVSEICFHAPYLTAIGKAAKLYSPSHQGITVETHGNFKPVVIKLGGSQANIILMPVRG